MVIRILILTFSLGVVSGQSVGEFTQQASQLVLQHEWEKAISLLKTGLAQHPRQPELLLQLGSLLVRSGRFGEGEKLLQEALEQQPGNSEVLRNAGEAQLKQGRFASAVALFRESLQHSSENVETHHRLAFALLAEGQEELALEHALQAVELNPLDPRFRRLYALLLDTQGEDETAYEQLKLAYRLAPRDANLLLELSERRWAAGHLFQALEYLELATEVDPENPLYHEKLSDLYEQLGQTERAEEEAKWESDLRRAFEKYITAMSLAVQGRKVEAIGILEPVVHAYPEFVTGTMLLADLYQKVGQRNRAFDLYLKIVEQDPFQASAREEGAWIQVQKGLLDSALRLLEDAGVQTPNYILIAAYQRLIREDWTGALEYFRQVEARNPLHPDLLQLISYCLNAQGEKKEALRHLDKAEALRPGDPEIKLQMREIKLDDALDLISEKKWRAGLEILQELMKEDVEADYLLPMAYCYQQLGDLGQAAERYRAGLEAEPDATWARINFASTLYRLGKYQESANQWERILQKSKTPDTYYQLGLSYSHLGRFPEAEYAFDKSVQLGDQRPEVLYNLGLSRLRSKRLNEARDLIRRAAVEGYPPARELLAKLAQ